jgi:hypothetical protein
MRIRRLLAAAATACTIAAAGASTASAHQAVYFNERIGVGSFFVSGTPRNTLFAGGGELREFTGTWEFCTAAQLNSNGSLADFACSTGGSGFVETFGSVGARSWIHITHVSGNTTTRLVGEEYWSTT